MQIVLRHRTIISKEKLTRISARFCKDTLWKKRTTLIPSSTTDTIKRIKKKKTGISGRWAVFTKAHRVIFLKNLETCSTWFHLESLSSHRWQGCMGLSSGLCAPPLLSCVYLLAQCMYNCTCLDGSAGQRPNRWQTLAMVDRVQITLSLSVAPLHLLSLAVLNQTGTRTQNVAIGDNHLITLWRGILEGVGLKGFLEWEGFFI